ncbi:MAG: FG-GAP-like repeat-containing protein, partial [Bacteroidota bacterium]
KVYLYAGGQLQYYEQSLSRGYESSVSPIIHFGLDTLELIDSLRVVWPDGKTALRKGVAINQFYTLVYEEASAPSAKGEERTKEPLLKEAGEQLNLLYQHEEEDVVDFKIQPLLPHKHSQNGPGIAVGDINGDGWEDIYIGGSANYPGAFFIQQANGGFTAGPTAPDSIYEDMGTLFFDADGDGDLDWYVVSGGSRFEKGAVQYEDRLYLNHGNGQFVLAPNALPQMPSSGSSVNAADFDRDGDLDLFVGGRIIPGEYPSAPRSYLLRNDSKEGTCLFTDQTQNLAPKLQNPGLVTSALWTDYDNDGWVDLLLTGEWMPIRFFHNKQGQLQALDEGIPNSHGWWNSLAAGDFDADGDTDYLAGNLGLNSRYKTSPQEPLCVYASDYDKNGRIDPVLCYYIQSQNYLSHTRDQLIKQINAMRGRFRNYEDYAKATFDRSFTKAELANAQVFRTETFANSYIENLGNGQFALHPLPRALQMAPIYGMLVQDINLDGNLDVLFTGNSYATAVAIGRYDAGNGGLLLGDGQGNFQLQPMAESGFKVDGDAKGMALLMDQNKQALYLVASNQGQLKVFQHGKAQASFLSLSLQANDASLRLYFKDGRQIKQELYYGSTYLSQSSRQLVLPSDLDKIEVVGFDGQIRILNAF